MLHLLSIYFYLYLHVTYVYASERLFSDNAGSNTLLAPHLTIHLDNNTVTDQRNQTSVFVPHGNGESISKRKNVRDCINTVAGVVGAFSTGAGAAAAWYNTFHKDLPGEIKYRLDRSECGLVTHLLCKSGHKCLKYIYTASDSCSTTAEAGTIRGGLEAAWNQYIKYNYDGVWCLNLSHSGKWKGYVLVGPDSHWG